jgi:hypothetical protein
LESSEKSIEQLSPDLQVLDTDNKNVGKSTSKENTENGENPQSLALLDKFGFWGFDFFTQNHIPLGDCIADSEFMTTHKDTHTIQEHLMEDPYYHVTAIEASVEGDTHYFVLKGYNNWRKEPSNELEKERAIVKLSITPLNDEEYRQISSKLYRMSMQYLDREYNEKSDFILTSGDSVPPLPIKNTQSLEYARNLPKCSKLESDEALRIKNFFDNPQEIGGSINGEGIDLWELEGEIPFVLSTDNGREAIRIFAHSNGSAVGGFKLTMNLDDFGMIGQWDIVDSASIWVNNVDIFTYLKIKNEWTQLDMYFMYIKEGEDKQKVRIFTPNNPYGTYWGSYKSSRVFDKK